MDRNMIAVEMGSSIGSAAKPKTPPIPPAVPARILWRRLDGRAVVVLTVNSASSKVFVRAERLAEFTFDCQFLGSKAKPRSMGEPNRFARRIAKRGFSKRSLASRKSRKSFGVKLRIGGASMQHYSSIL